MDSHLWSVLKDEIHDKCIYYEYIEQSADSSLSDYIVSIIQMGKTPDEVSTELGGLIGPDYDRYLTQWIFARMEELKNQKPALSANAPATTTTTSTPPAQQQRSTTVFEINEKMMTEEEGTSSKPAIEKPTTQRNRMFSQAFSGLGQRQQLQQQRYQSPDYYDRNGRDQRRDHRDIHADRRQESQRFQPDRRQQHRPDYRRDHSRSRSRSRSPIRQTDRTVHREYKGDTIFARLGKPSGDSASSSRESRTTSVFDRLGIKKPERVETQESEQKRCKYWPTCDKGDDCIFVHPHTLCPDFPNCPNKATECLFIHPYTPKKPSHTVTDSTLTEKAIPCRYFPHCNNDQCPYFHPPAVSSYYEPQPQSYPSYQPYQPAPQLAPSVKRIPVPCKNGEHCSRPDCHFLHPKDTSPAEVICKFDGACTRPGCFYKHVAQSNVGFGNSHNKSLVVNQSSTMTATAPSKSQREFAIGDDSQVEKMQLGESADLIKPKDQELDTDMDL